VRRALGASSSGPIGIALEHFDASRFKLAARRGARNSASSLLSKWDGSAATTMTGTSLAISTKSPRCTTITGRDSFSLRAADAATDRARCEPASDPSSPTADGQLRIVRNRRTDSDEDRIGFGAKRLHLSAGSRAGDGYLALAPAADHAVGGNCKLENHIGAMLRLAGEIGGERMLALFLQEPLSTSMPASRSMAMPLPETRIRIRDADDDAADAMRRSALRRRVASCRDASKAPASHRRWRRGPIRRLPPAPAARHAADHRSRSRRGRRSCPRGR
jgi:hypothetical protein